MTPGSSELRNFPDKAKEHLGINFEADGALVDVPQLEGLNDFDQLEVTTLTLDKIQSYSTHCLCKGKQDIHICFKKVQGISFSVHELQL